MSDGMTPGSPEPTPELRRQLLAMQRNEITEYHVYKRLAQRQTDTHNRDVLQRIAEEERNHHDFWQGYTGVPANPSRLQITLYALMARLLGLTFAVKLMERGEESAQLNYEAVAGIIHEAKRVLEEEEENERRLLAILDEEWLQYIGYIVLGLSDALVELTGALAGLTLALANSRLIALIGLITGIAAAMSMAASEYLSRKAEEKEGHSPLKAAVYTGIAYIVTVALLVASYLLLANPLASLAATLFFAILIIVVFTYYLAVVRDMPFKHRFLEMAGLCLGVSIVSFGIGFVLRQAFGIDL